MTRVAFLLSFLSLIGACEATVGSRTRTDGGGSVPGVDGSTSRDGGGFTLRDSGPGSCAPLSARAETAFAPVDIVWIIDNSGSMSEEASLIQQNLNQFATTIEGAGLDVHVVLITAAGFAEVPAPLGTDPSRFLRVEQDVQSHNAFERLIETFPMWSPFLRRTSALNFVVTTDDTSNMSADDFNMQLLGLIGRSYRFHAIASPPGSSMGTFPPTGCRGPHGDARGDGVEYWDISRRTGGTQHSICEPDWSGLFRDLSTAIAVPLALPCTFQIPEPPSCEVFDPGQVNVDYINGSTGALMTFPYTGGESSCTGDGWYYDADDPANASNVVLCPTSCTRVENDEGGRIDVAFGCDTLLI